MAKRDNRWCLICQPRNRTLYWHQTDPEKLKANPSLDPIYCFCNKCDRIYSLSQYCETAGIDIADFIADGDLDVAEARPDEVNAMAWPHTFVPLSDPRAAAGLEYVKTRGLSPEGDMYYDLKEEGIVFPYYVDNQFCGAQIRFIKERVNDEGDVWKITTMPGTRLGLLFYGWNQEKFLSQVKAVVVTEGAFNSIALQQALNHVYGGVSRCPWRVIACSGSGATEHQANTLKELKDQGYKIVLAPDTDAAGIKMYRKFADAKAATHYAFTGDTEKDWNDLLKEMGYKELARFFLKMVEPIDVGEK